MTPQAYAQMAKLQARHWWFTARRNILRGQLQGMNLVPAARILEVGCGPGGNLQMLQEFGDVTAVEMDDGARQFAADLSGLRILPGHLPDGLPAMGDFDLIGLFDVLEHVPQDRLALQVLRPLLRPGGQLLLTVPANPWMFGPHDRAHHHQRRYSASQLRQLCAQAGWEVTHLTHFNTLLYPVVALARILALVSRRQGEHSDTESMPHPIFNRLLHTIFASEAAWLRHLRFPFGVSLLCILRPTK